MTLIMVCLMDTKTAQLGSNMDFKCQKYHMLFRGHLNLAYSGMNSILEEENLNTYIRQSFNYNLVSTFKSSQITITYHRYFNFIPEIWLKIRLFPFIFWLIFSCYKVQIWRCVQNKRVRCRIYHRTSKMK